jgi:serine/threonine-protein kinase RsbW
MVISVPRQMGSLGLLVAFVRDFLATEGLAETSAFEIDLVLEELFTNLVRHGQSGRDAVDVSLVRSNDDLVLTLIEYDADLFDPTKAPEVDVDRPIAERRAGGLGIHLVRVLSRDFQYDWQDRLGTTTVTMRVTDPCST